MKTTKCKIYHFLLYKDFFHFIIHIHLKGLHGRNKIGSCRRTNQTSKIVNSEVDCNKKQDWSNSGRNICSVLSNISLVSRNARN